jgi:hypothetical protein
MALGPDTTPGDSGAFRPGSLRGVDGFFRVAQLVTGQWWLLEPEGRPFFARAVHQVRAVRVDAEPLTTLRDPAAQLRQWGFNAVGVGGDGAGREDGLPFLGVVDFGLAAPLISAPGVRLPDVFDPDWPAHAALRAAAVCTPLATTRELIGWVSDDAIAWGSAPAANRPGLLQVCLSLEPAFPAYHAAWEFVLALHGGRLEAVEKAWAIPLGNKEVVREMTRSESGIVTRGYLRDEVRWTREFARRYFGATAAAIRAADGNHLLCGCRFGTPAGTVLAEATYPAIDVVLAHWTELPAHGGAANPVFASEVSWADESFWALSADAAGRPLARGRLTAVERMLRRGRTALKRLARHPAAVGYFWRQWCDEPGEQPPFAHGLVHVNGAEAREHTELLAEFNARADSLRRSAAKLLSP